MKKLSNIRKREIKDGIFRILEMPNIYFPMMQKGQRFKVANTCFAKVPDKLLSKYDRFKLNVNPFVDHNIFFMRDLTAVIWGAIKSEGLHKTYKDCWLVPVDIKDFNFNGKREVEVVIDILSPVDKKEIIK